MGNLRIDSQGRAWTVKGNRPYLDDIPGQQPHQLFHVLNPVFGTDEEGVGGIDYHEVFRAEEGDGTTSLGQGEGVSAIHGKHLTAERVALLVGGQMGGEGGPGAHIIPWEGGF